VRSRRWVPFAAAVLFFACLWLVRLPGPDFVRYLEWARVALSADLFQLQGDTLSPFGVPFSLWSYGPGFIFATSKAVLGHPAAAIQSAFVVGWVGSILFWVVMYKLLLHLAGGRAALVLFGLSLAFVGTHAGFYSFAHASESLSLACFAVLAYWIVLPRGWQLLDALVLGVAGALVIIIRAQLALYVIPALGIFAYLVAARDRGSVGGGALVAGAAFPILVALVQVLMAGRWMTGSFFSSPYMYGLGAFKSLDFAQPELGAVLLHPWHGLLVYHPLYGLCFVALLCELASAPSGRQRLLYGSVIVLLCAHVYLQAAHFAWWLGTETFGMRGLAVFSVILVPVLVAHLRRRQEQGRSIAVWILAAVPCVLWSYLLLRQGATNFLTYPEVLSAQLARFRTEVAFVNVIPLLICAGSVELIRRSENRRDTGSTVLPTVVAVSLSALAWFALLSEVADRYAPTLRLDLASTTALKSIAGLAPVGLWLALTGAAEGGRSGRRFELAAALGVILVFATVSVSFARLAVRTETMDLEEASRRRVFTYSGTVDWEEFEATYQEYARVPGFDDKKKRFREFLDMAAVRPIR